MSGFVRDDEVIAAVSLNFDPAVSAVAERLLSGRVITKKEAQYVISPCCSFAASELMPPQIKGHLFGPIIFQKHIHFQILCVTENIHRPL